MRLALIHWILSTHWSLPEGKRISSRGHIKLFRKKVLFKEDLIAETCIREDIYGENNGLRSAVLCGMRNRMTVQRLACLFSVWCSWTANGASKWRGPWCLSLVFVCRCHLQLHSAITWSDEAIMVPLNKAASTFPLQLWLACLSIRSTRLETPRTMDMRWEERRCVISYTVLVVPQARSDLLVKLTLLEANLDHRT